MNSMERNSAKSINDKIENMYSQDEGDIFLKHNEDDRSTGVIIRKNNIAIQTGDGKYGMVVREKGEINLQGQVVFNTLPGQKKTKHIILGKTNENFLSFIPSTLWTEIPSMLFSAPNISMITGMAGMLNKFLQATPGGK